VQPGGRKYLLRAETAAALRCTNANHGNGLIRYTPEISRSTVQIEHDFSRRTVQKISQQACKIRSLKSFPQTRERLIRRLV